MPNFTPGKSAPFHLSEEEKMKILHALGYSLASATIAGLLALCAMDIRNVPYWIVPVIPALNTFLYGMKLWLMDNR